MLHTNIGFPAAEDSTARFPGHPEEHEQARHRFMFRTTHPRRAVPRLLKAVGLVMRFTDNFLISCSL